MIKFLTKLFGTKSERDLRILQPYVKKIHLAYETLSTLTDQEIRNTTQTLRETIQGELAPIETEIALYERTIEENTTLSTKELQSLYQKIQQGKDQYHQQLEKVLLAQLPLAFAVVKETARRLTQNKQLIVTATDYDRLLAENESYVTIQGDQAVWHNQWDIMGHPFTWEMIHFDSQLVGGVVLHMGKIAEMATGEGKTLVATLPTYLNALAGKGIHIVTVNEYLAKRDAAWMKPIYQFHGLSVACIEETPPHSAARRAAYHADITYGTNNEFGFDYLRDNMASRTNEVVQRGHHYAIVDEVDSVLIDDARTPLIISGPVEKSTEQVYMHFNPRVQNLHEAQKKIINELLQEAKAKQAAGNQEEAGLALFRSYRGLPKYKPLIKYLSEPGVKQLLHKVENYYLQDNARMMHEADEPLLFSIDEKHNTVELTEKGIEFITQQGEDVNFFVLPDLSTALAAIDNQTDLELKEKECQEQALIREYTIKSDRIHAVQQLLKAYTLFEKDIDYILDEGKVKIVDENTGRISEGRRYSEGLHQALEAKEKTKIEKASQTRATITLQNYFRLYAKLAGMTGTAETEASEFYSTYKLDVVIAPPHKTLQRQDVDDKVYKTAREKFQAIIEEIADLSSNKRPVLVGTVSVEISELLSKMLTLRKIKHQVLNAKQHQREAEIITEAGNPGTVTIATNMAGRGTDIKLSPAAREAGGLAIIGSERHESRRVDRQLRGRAGRQGDPGTSQFFVSLEDPLMRLFISDRITKVMDKLGLKEGEMIQHSMVTKSIERAQKKVEQNNYAYRERLLQYDNELNKQRTIIYNRRKDVLMGKKVHVEMIAILQAIAEKIAGQDEAKNEYKDIKQKMSLLGGSITGLTPEIHHTHNLQQLTELIHETLKKNYEEKINLFREQSQALQEALKQQPNWMTARAFSLTFTNGDQPLNVSIDIDSFKQQPGETLIKSLQRVIILHYIDHFWQEHLRYMDELRQAVQHASYEQKDPLLIYKLESYTLFTTMVAKLNEAILAYFLQAHFLIEDTNANQPTNQPTTPVLEKTNEPKKPFPAPITSRRVSVQYADGTIKKRVLYQRVAKDLQQKRCVLLDKNDERRG